MDVAEVEGEIGRLMSAVVKFDKINDGIDLSFIYQMISMIFSMN
jgi:hypothetical protein